GGVGWGGGWFGMTSAVGGGWRGLAASVVSAGLSLIVMVLVVGAFGYDPVLVGRAFVKAVAGGAGPVADLLLVACPLVIVGLAVTLAFRCGVWDIWAEGQYLAGSAVPAG